MNREIVERMKEYIKQKCGDGGRKQNAACLHLKLKRATGIDCMEYASEWAQARIEELESRTPEERHGLNEFTLPVLRYLAEHGNEDVRKFGWKPVPKELYADIEKQCLENDKHRRSFKGPVRLWG